MGRPFLEKFANVSWEKNEEHLQAWKDGRTGVPIVDAGMRQANKMGWMHNRVRMITAMYLVKDLMIDWRLGEKVRLLCSCVPRQSVTVAHYGGGVAVFHGNSDRWRPRFQQWRVAMECEHRCRPSPLFQDLQSVHTEQEGPCDQVRLLL